MLSAVARDPAKGPRRRHHHPVAERRSEAGNHLQFPWPRAWPLLELSICLNVLITLLTVFGHGKTRMLSDLVPLGFFRAVIITVSSVIYFLSFMHLSIYSV